eukprot:COSAG05_NODE_21196_length_273_cov_16.160920_1_plen_76_part_01
MDVFLVVVAVVVVIVVVIAVVVVAVVFAVVAVFLVSLFPCPWNRAGVDYPLPRSLRRALRVPVVDGIVRGDEPLPR